MQYIIYRLSFQTGVHFGDGILNDTKSSFCADTLFSALCIEALRRGAESLEQLYTMARRGDIRLSDGFPFIQETLYLPKPLLVVDHTSEDPSNRKKWKNLSYVPLERMEEFLLGEMDADVETEMLDGLGRAELRQLVNLQNPEKSEPYAIGIYHFYENNGLYFILGYENDSERAFVKELLSSLSYQGFGGKTSSGLGKFSISEQELPKKVLESLSVQTGRFLVLSTSLPRRDEMEDVIREANYLLVKRSGFIQSDTYSEELVKKQDMYFVKSGSIVHRRYEGDVYSVGTKGRHPVWRYGKPILMEV